MSPDEFIEKFDYPGRLVMLTDVLPNAKYWVIPDDDKSGVNEP